jgi:hypothetical protein
MSPAPHHLKPCITVIGDGRVYTVEVFALTFINKAE